MASPKVSAVIHYKKPGTQPPLFVAGTFSEPAWSPKEMDFTRDENGELHFSAQIEAAPGSTIQYKIRIGTDNWWVLNEDAPTADDGSGNWNNVIEIPVGKGLHAPSAANESKDVDEDATVPPEAGGPQHPAVTNAAKELMARSASRAGASTPRFAKTAAEVADSAALLDKEEAGHKISGEEAGRIGTHKLASTSMSEVAKTAAEVADSVQNLGTETVLRVHTPPGAFGEISLGQERNRHGDHTPPLFAHECLGAYDPAGAVDNELEGPGDQPASRTPPELDDYNDPRLERFPSNRSEIMDAVRKIETGLNEDHALFEGVPPSPIVGRSGRNTDELLEVSPIAAYPTSPRFSRRAAPASPSERSLALSLLSISEADDKDYMAPIVLPRAAVKDDRHVSKTPGSDEDEAVALKDIGRATRATAEPREPHLPSTALAAVREMQEPPVSGVEALRPGGARASGNAAEGLKNDSPRTAVQPPAEEDAVEPSDVGAHHDTGAAEQTTASVPETYAQLRKRRLDGRQVSAEDNPDQAEPQRVSSREGWLGAFFRSFFMEWIGPLMRRLCGTRQNKLLTAGTVVLFGLALWRLAGRERW